MITQITQEQIRELGNYLQGTCASIEDAGRACDITIDDATTIQAQMAEACGIDVCTGCGWWHSDDELNDVTGELYCFDCSDCLDDPSTY